MVWTPPPEDEEAFSEVPMAPLRPTVRAPSAPDRGVRAKPHNVRTRPLFETERSAIERAALERSARERAAVEELVADVPASPAPVTSPGGAAPRTTPARPGTTPTRPMSAPEKILQRLDWKVIRRLDGVLQGDYRSLFRGNGIDLVDLREYQPGDDVRAIDWNVTARMDTPYVREYVEDRELTAWFLLDLSPSVDFGTADSERVKRTVLIDFVATLARVLTRRGNRVGAMFYDSTLKRTLPARGGRDQVLRLIDDLLRQPRLASSPFTDLTPLLDAAAHAVKRRSLIFIISDFISVPGWERPLSLLNRRHEVVAVRLLDPREVELPDVGTLIMEDAETGEQLYVDTHDAAFRRRFAQAALRREAEVHGAFRRSGVEALSLSTDDDLVRAIVRMASIRRRRRR
jgi:uncharacterized protein (DUF58 family)